MRFIHARVARIRELKGQTNIFAARPPCCGDIYGSPHLHASIRNTDPVCLKTKFSQSVNQSVRQTDNLYAGVVACTHLPAHPEQCRRAPHHPSSRCSTRKRSLTILLSLVSRTLTTENTRTLNHQSASAKAPPTTYHPAKHHGMSLYHLLALRTCQRAQTT